MNQRLSDLEIRVDTNEQVLSQTKDITDANRLDIEDILSKMHELGHKLNGLDGL
jgi:uncharacterized coiled-coil protein SlyX